MMIPVCKTWTTTSCLAAPTYINTTTTVRPLQVKDIRALMYDPINPIHRWHGFFRLVLWLINTICYGPTVVASSLEQGPNRDYGLSLLYLNWGQLLCFLCFNQPIRPGGHGVRCGLSVARICTLFRWAIIRMIVMEYSGIVTQMWPTNEYNKIYREFFTWTRFLFGSQWANQL